MRKADRKVPRPQSLASLGAGTWPERHEVHAKLWPLYSATQPLGHFLLEPRISPQKPLGLTGAAAQPPAA